VHLKSVQCDFNRQYNFSVAELAAGKESTFDIKASKLALSSILRPALLYLPI
jgi:Ran GTPase-activating protein (RanGAP) involved in mRNA processing and transport